MSPTSARRAAAGFTLIEVIAVLAITALAASAAPYFWRQGQAIYQSRAVARTLAADLRGLRSQAQVTGREVAIAIDAHGRGYAARAAQLSRALPEGFRIAYAPAVLHQPRLAEAVLRFHPDGSSTGGRMTLSANGSSRHVVVDWLTGRVRVVD